MRDPVHHLTNPADRLNALADAAVCRAPAGGSSRPRSPGSPRQSSRPDDLAEEVTAAGFADTELLVVEGVGAFTRYSVTLLNDPTNPALKSADRASG